MITNQRYEMLKTSLKNGANIAPVDFEAIREYETVTAKKFEPTPKPQMVSDCCKAKIQYLHFKYQNHPASDETVAQCSNCGKACVPVDKEPAEKETLPHPNYECSDDGCMVCHKPAAPIENPSLLKRLDKANTLALFSKLPDQCGLLLSDKVWQDFRKELKTFDAAHKVPTVEEIAEIDDSQYQLADALMGEATFEAQLSTLRAEIAKEIFEGIDEQGLIDCSYHGLTDWNKFKAAYLAPDKEGGKQ